MDDFEDNIRPADQIISDQLLDDNRSEYEKQIDKAMYLSLQEMTNQREIHRQYEQQLVKEYNEETKRRTELFKDFLFNINKIGKFDKEIGEIYNILDPIIESYCGQFIQTCELDEETYNNIFNTLKKIRNNPIALDTLKTIILKS